MQKKWTPAPESRANNFVFRCRPVADHTHRPPADPWADSLLITGGENRQSIRSAPSHSNLACLKQRAKQAHGEPQPRVTGAFRRCGAQNVENPATPASSKGRARVDKTSCPHKPLVVITTVPWWKALVDAVPPRNRRPRKTPSEAPLVDSAKNRRRSRRRPWAKRRRVLAGKDATTCNFCMPSSAHAGAHGMPPKI